MSGDVASAHLSYIVRDHDKALLLKDLILFALLR